MAGRLVQLDFSAAFDRVNHCGLLSKLRSIGVRGQSAYSWGKIRLQMPVYTKHYKVHNAV